MSNLPEKKPTNVLSIYSRPPGTTTIQIRREMVTVPEVAKALGKVDKYIFAASTKTLISEMEDLELVNKTKQLFRFIAIDVGYTLPNDPTDWAYMCTRLLDFLKKYFELFSLADIKLAFEMAASGELNEFLPKDREGKADKNHYQQFNVDYFGKILNAYKARRGDVIHKAMKALPEPERVVSQQEKNYYHNITVDTCKYAFLKYKYLDVFELTGLEEKFIYDWLNKHGFVDKIVQTIEDREKALSRYLNRAASGVVNRFTAQQVRKEGIKSPEINFTTYEIARLREIKKAFDRMIIDGVFINNYLEYRK